MTERITPKKDLEVVTIFPNKSHSQERILQEKRELQIRAQLK